ncbi:MAG: benzoyl-CoA reductase subunit C [Candidatus Krumholzibacteriia bacterium]
MGVSDIVGRCEELYHDLHFSYVKDWKKRQGGLAIGYMPIYVPRELIHAAGMLPVGIMGASDNIEIIRGDAYYQSYICHIPRSTIELGLGGRLDCLDGLLFPAICDVIRNLSGMWKLMFKDKYVKYIDLPQNFSADIGGKFYVNELNQLRQDLGAMAGKPIGNDELNESIRLYNENTKAIEQLYELRAGAPHMVPTYELYLLMRAANVLEVSEHTGLVEEYLSLVQKEDRREMDNIRVIVTGVFCEQPPLGLIRALEQSGCYIVDDDWVLGTRFITNEVAVTDDPVRALSDAYLEYGIATASRYIDKDEKGRHLIDRVKKLDAEGVIFASPSFCDPALLERPMLQSALTRANIPNTSFKFSENSGQYQVIKEQTGTFSDSIKLWGTA